MSVSVDCIAASILMCACIFFHFNSDQLGLVNINLISGCCFLLLLFCFLDAELNLFTFHSHLLSLLVFCWLERRKKRILSLNFRAFETELNQLNIKYIRHFNICASRFFFSRDINVRRCCMADLRLVCTPVAPEMEVWTLFFHFSLISFFSFIFAHFSFNFLRFKIQAENEKETKKTNEQTKCSVC